MPQTINGIGTRYYGKKNHQTRSATCKHCGRSSNLESYDTRLWFAVLFIPLIPLGRKRIMDHCPICTKHYTVALSKWEADKQRDITKSRDKFQTERTPESALELHDCLLGYQDLDHAAEFRKIIQETFPHDARVHEHLGVALSHLDQLREADEAFEKSHSLDPERPIARIGTAYARIRTGRLDEARELVGFLLQPGASREHSMSVLVTLADAYLAKGQPQQALEMYRALLTELPALGNDPAFRRQVKLAEKAGTPTASMLPTKAFGFFRDASDSKRKWVAAAVLVALVVAGFAASNEWIRRNRRVHIVNDFPKPLTVSIDGVGSVEVGPRGNRFLTLPEGSYTAKVTGAVEENIPFTIECDYLFRWITNPMWVVNPGGLAVLEQTMAVYSISKDERGYQNYKFGERFSYFPEVNLEFQEVPKSMSVKRSEKRKQRTSVMLYTGSVADLFYYSLDKLPKERLRTYAESRLKFRPDESDLIEPYLRVWSSPKDIARLNGLLKAGLSHRPVNTEWHRLYQSFQMDEWESLLIMEYDAMIAAEPESAALLYLRGRLGNTKAESRAYFEKARTADPKYPYASYALGFDRLTEADFASARPLLEQALLAQPYNTEYRQRWLEACIGLGDFEAVEKELRRLKNGRQGIEIALEMADFLASRDRFPEALKVVDEVRVMLGNRKDWERPQDTLASARASVLYTCGDFASVAKMKDVNKLVPLIPVWIGLEEGKVREVVESDVGQSMVNGNGFDQLAVALAWDLAGNPGEAAKLRESAADRFSTAGVEERRLGALLSGDLPPTRENIDAVVLQPTQKALACSVLARQFPEHRATLQELARKLNVGLYFPMRLIRKANG